MPAVSPRLGCRRCPSAVVALFTYVCASYACTSCAGWGAAASFAQFMASSVSAWRCGPAFVDQPHELPLIRCPYGVLCVSSLIVVCYSCSVCAGCVAGSCSYLAQCRQSGNFFPQIRGFRTSLEDFCSWLGNFLACDCIPWLR